MSSYVKGVSGTDEVYESKWPHYESMMFLERVCCRRDVIYPNDTTVKVRSIFYCQFLSFCHAACGYLAEDLLSFFIPCTYISVCLPEILVRCLRPPVSCKRTFETISLSHTHTHTHTYTCAHMCMYAHTHAHMHTHTCIHRHTHTHTHTYTHTCMHACTHTHTYTHTHTETHTDTHTCAQGRYMDVPTLMHVHTHTHACVHMHTHTHTQV